MLNKRENRNIRWQEVLHTVWIVAAFILCARFLQFKFLDCIPGVKAIFARLSQICAAAIMIVFLISFRKVPKMLYISLCAVYGLSFVATLLNSGNLRIMIGSAYPVLALNAFVILECSTLCKAKKFLRTLANFFLTITTINLLLMVIAPGLFGKTETTQGNIFFMGLENQIGYPCVIGLLLVLLNDCLNKEKWKVQYYAIVLGLITLLNFSVGSLIGAFVLFLYLTVPPVSKLFDRCHLMVFVTVVGVLLVILVFFNEPVLGFSPIRFIIENILGKDITLTNRTIIWDVAIEKILERPVWGYGIGDTGDVFTILSIDEKAMTLSSHNQFLQIWYEGGSVTMIFFVVFLTLGGTLLKKSPDKRIAAYTKLIVTTLLIMYLTEAPNFGCLYFALNIGVSLALCLEKEHGCVSAVNEQSCRQSQDKITVVVPVYNVRKFLGECLDSIVNQTYRNLEIIVVNDGSTDDSYEICEKYAAKEPRIILIDQKNQGLSGARNSGIRIATGKYITFIDSDDAILPDMIEYLHHLITVHNADMSVCQWLPIDEEGKPIANRDVFLDKVFRGKEQCMKALFRDDELSVTAWGKLYKTTAFETVEYALGKYHEDVYTTHQLVAQCECIAAGAQRKYLYRQRGGSIVHAAFSPKHLDAVEGSVLQAEFVEKRYANLKTDALGEIIWACNSCAMRMKNSEQLDEKAVSYLQKCYRKYEGAFLLGNSRMAGKLFSIAAFVNLKTVLNLLMKISKMRR